jgi:hypothetical protein
VLCASLLFHLRVENTLGLGLGHRLEQNGLCHVPQAILPGQRACVQLVKILLSCLSALSSEFSTARTLLDHLKVALIIRGNNVIKQRLIQPMPGWWDWAWAWACYGLASRRESVLNGLCKRLGLVSRFARLTAAQIRNWPAHICCVSCSERDTKRLSECIRCFLALGMSRA